MIMVKFLFVFLLFGFLECSTITSPCDPNPCHNGGHCELTYYPPKPFLCTCPDPYTGNTCTDIKLPCEYKPCQNNGVCYNLLKQDGWPQDSYECLCPTGYSGLNCEYGGSNNPCDPNSCVNGNCVVDPHYPDGYVCICYTDKFYGLKCESDPCSSNPCGDGFVCETNGQEYRCVCPAGRYGPDCSEIGVCPSIVPSVGDICLHECSTDDDCLNGKMCCTTGCGYLCTYPVIKSDDMCENHMCQNGGTCVPMPALPFFTPYNRYACDCTSGYEGALCEIPTEVCDACRPNPCQNGGTCVECSTSTSGYYCECPSDNYVGENCEIEEHDTCNPCDPNPCYHGKCKRTSTWEYECYCDEGYAGVVCSESKQNDLCYVNPCKNGGVCESDGTNQWCVCKEGFMGPTCEAPVSPCASAPCKNGATCFYSGSIYKCVCPSGYTGKTCTDKTVSNPCDPNPCLNEGTCTPYGENYECGCTAEYDGRNCEAPVVPNPCDNNPCQNNAECSQISSAPYYQCVCPSDFTGTNCDQSVVTNPCDNNPCQNSGTCKPLTVVPYYRCNCDQTFAAGPNCEYTPCVSSPCLSGETCEVTTTSPYYSCAACVPGGLSVCGVSGGSTGPCSVVNCQNGGSCNEGSGTFSCTCVNGYTGTFCEVSPCQSVNCQNGGQCEEITGVAPYYRCNCVSGFTGTTCGNSPCGTTTCGSNGQCDVINVAPFFQCSCRNGFSGGSCQISPCDSEPCKNGGICSLDNTDPYYGCTCVNNFGGPTCEIEQPPTECTLNCQNGGTCVPMPSTNGNCRCADGWGGTLCTDRTCEGFCLNGGACSMASGNPTCACGDGFNGIQCENVCDLTCVNGLCIFNFLDQPTCDCYEGSKGALCELTDPCYPNQCSPSEVCEDDLRGGFNCLPSSGK